MIGVKIALTGDSERYFVRAIHRFGHCEVSGGEIFPSVAELAA